jgi:hypothetical protein
MRYRFRRSVSLAIGILSLIVFPENYLVSTRLCYFNIRQNRVNIQPSSGANAFRLDTNRQHRFDTDAGFTNLKTKIIRVFFSH